MDVIAAPPAAAAFAAPTPLGTGTAAPAASVPLAGAVPAVPPAATAAVVRARDGDFTTLLDAAQAGNGLPPDGNPLPLVLPWMPLPASPTAPAAVAAARPAAEAVARPLPGGLPATTASSPGRGPEVPLERLGLALPPQVVALAAAKGGAPGRVTAEGMAPAAAPPPADLPEAAPSPPPSPSPPQSPAPAPSGFNGPALPPLAPGPVTGPPPPATDAAATALQRSLDRNASPAPTAASQPVAVADGAPAAALPSAGMDTGSDAAGAPPPVPATQPAPLDAAVARLDAATAPSGTAAAAGPAVAQAAPRDTPAAAMQLSEAPGSEAWSRALGERVVIMADRDLTHARIALNPPQLGPIEVRVQVTGDQASVAFTAHSHLTREAIEQALPRLREMLGGQGFTQVDVNVSQHSFSERPRQAPGFEPPPPSLPADLPLDAPAPAWRPSASARLDLYA